MESQKIGFGRGVTFNETVRSLDDSSLYKLNFSKINTLHLDISIRKRDINIHSGVSRKKDNLTMYYRKEINMLNTLDEKIAKIHFRNGYKKKNIQVNSLNFFISKHSKKLKKIDFLNIDVEGVELEVLKSLNFKVSDCCGRPPFRYYIVEGFLIPSG